MFYKEENLKKLLVTIALSLAIILPLNLLPMVLYLAGFFHYPPSEDLGQGSLIIGLLFFLLMYALPYFSIGYFGHMKRKIGILGCLVATIVCFATTFLVTYGLSGYMFATGSYINPPGSVPIGFWHYTVGSNLSNALMGTSLMFRLVGGFISSLIFGMSIPCVFFSTVDSVSSTLKKV